MAVLIATTSAADLATLGRILAPDAGVRTALTCADAIHHMNTAPISVILCDAELPDGNWRYVLARAGATPVVVFSRFADEELWSEVLHFGAYDLLLLPFDADEVRRVTAAAARSRTEGAIMIHV